MNSDFVHLHVHTEYSLLDGACRIKDLCAQAAKLGMKSLAITDHGVMFGVIDFYKEAVRQGIKPIIGCEVYVAARSRHDKSPGPDARSSHLVLLAKNGEGYKNLIKLVSIGYTEGYYYRPRVDFDTLERHNAGLIALSACLSGDIPAALAAGDEVTAARLALKYKGIFGNGFYLELQDNGFPEQKAVNAGLIRLARRHDIPLAVTNDVHYIDRGDARAQDVLMCIQTGKTVDDEDRMKLNSSEMYLKSADEMAARFKNFGEALANTARIADMCNVELEFGKIKLPKFKLPAGRADAFAYLKELSAAGIAKRYPGGITDEIAQRLEFELSVIGQMGYVDYFLIVWDFIRFARESSIPVGPGRGSVAGSLVSYALGITNVDPLRYKLFFERFLNPGRISMPDIDIDFCYERRGEVIDYVIRKYGADHVAHIITFGTMAARAVIRDVGRALNIQYGEVDKIAKMIPFQLGMTIDRALELNSELLLQYNENPKYRELIDMAIKLEGMPRHASTHAAGVLITDQPVTEYVPLQKNDDCVTTQFPMLQIEELGLLKMDFLGLRTLTVIHDTVAAIRESRGIDLDIERIDLNDRGVYKMICDGDTMAIFQLESDGMTQLMKEMQPDGIEDLSAGGALFRPGPMESIPRYVESKRNRSAIRYDDPKLEPILNVTYGCIVYQEQVLQIVREVAGYSFGQADLLRRAMSKKKHDIMENERKNFIYGVTDSDGNVLVPGAIRNGVSEGVAKKIFGDMADFASYGFNKSHSAAYAILIYQTAWLKYHYPVEFMSATLNSCMGFTDKVAHYIEQSRQRGIQVLPPDINRSLSKFSVVDGSLRFGLAAVKNIGNAAVDAIIEERRAHGPYRSFTDFLRRAGAASLNKRGVESLIRCGAFDSLKLTRSSLIMSYERLLEGIANSRRNQVDGQINFFGDLAGEGGLDSNIDAAVPIRAFINGAVPGGAFSDGIAGAGNAGNAGGAGNAASMGNAANAANGAEKYDDDVPYLPEYSHGLLLSMEKEILGLYVSGHPLDGFKSAIAEFTNCDTRAFRQGGGEDDGGTDQKSAADAVKNTVADGQNAVIGGIISRVKTKFTKSNTLMAFVDLEDLYGSVEILVFPKVFERLDKLLANDKIVLAKGRISMREDEDAKFILDDVAELGAPLREDGAGALNKDSGEYVRIKRWAASGYNGYGGGKGRSNGNGGGYGNGGYGGGNYAGADPYADGGGYMADENAGGPDGGAAAETRTLYIRVSGAEQKQALESAYSTLRYFSGRTPVVLYNHINKTRKDLGREYWVKPSDTLLAEMRERFGGENVVLR